MKIGIISEFNTQTVNYGNHLQAYALNLYLRNRKCDDQVESILLHPKLSIKYTNKFSVSFCKKIIRGVLRRIHKENYTVGSPACDCIERLASFERFRKNYIPMSKNGMTTNDLRLAGYDVIIVGSDVVWAQGEHRVTRTKFLDFSGVKPFKRISYAASFGRDYIPEENKKTISKYLKRFNGISVRERSSVAMLNEIGIPNVSYCVDPTLLISQEHWSQIETPPKEIDVNEEYVFVYLLGKNSQQRAEIMAYAKEHNQKVVVIPNADGTLDETAFGDIKLNNCSIENWIWLIHHADQVFTDSFHGVVFSTIFQKPFLVLPRNGPVDINNRLVDYLREIDQLDKIVSVGQLHACKNKTWDYEKIGTAIEIRRQASINFLEKALGDIGE